MKKIKFYFLLPVGIIIEMQYAFARAGGGSGGGAAGRGIGAIISLITLALTVYFINQKNKKAKKEIAISNNEDSFWNYDEMIQLANDAFYKMQDAWSQRNIDLVKDSITESLYTKYKKELHWMILKREQNIVGDIEIKKLKIIGNEDYLDNELDRFTVYISGKMIDYSISDRTLEIITNKAKERVAFADLYYFIRHDNKWLLDKIDNRVDLIKVLQAKQIVQ